MEYHHGYWYLNISFSEKTGRIKWNWSSWKYLSLEEKDLLNYR